ncbi:DUF6809 family protein [Paenibacillus senegalensis]|uniref:DUF6809 family protein n=1 Tax=Paenibacillus senegalensis TaxID=1465766 RepID=UPI0002894413|nr:hypothetical protein [Paenibacillus senegalensis]
MGDYISMVERGKLEAAYNNAEGNKIQTQDEVIFEHGMLTVLKEIASLKCLQMSEAIDGGPDNPVLRKSEERASELREHLEAVLPEDEINLLEDYTDAMWLTCTDRSYHAFILGFIEGYRFLKEAKCLHGGAFFE